MENNNGISTTLFTVTLENKVGAMDTLLGKLKDFNIIGLKLVNLNEVGILQFIVAPEFIGPATAVLKDGFPFTASTVYGVILPNTPGAFHTNVIVPIMKLGVGITNIITAVGTPLVFIGLDNAKLALPTLQSIPLPEPNPAPERTPVTA